MRHGEVDTGWLDRLTAAGLHQPTRHADVALVAAALDAADELHGIDRDRFFGWASRGRPQLDGSGGQQVELRHGATAYRVNVRRVSRHCFVIGVAGQSLVVERNPLGRARSRLTIAGRPFSVVSAIDGATHLVEVDGVTHRFSRDDAGIVRAPASALVVAVDVHPGDVVAMGDRVAVVEAMKMEIAINAPVSGAVSGVFVARNVQVDGGTPLLRIEPRGDAAPDSDAASPISLDELIAAGGQPSSADEQEETVRAFLLGYDVEPSAARQAAAALGDSAGSIAGILEVFADVSALTPERRPSDDEDEQRAPREYFNQYLRSLDPEREGIPTWFVERLERAVAHFGLDDLSPRPALDDALMRHVRRSATDRRSTGGRHDAPRTPGHRPRQ